MSSHPSAPSRAVPGAPGRRRLLAIFLVALVAVAAVTAGVVMRLTRGGDGGQLVAPSSAAVLAAERARPTSGRTVTRTITARPATIDLGGKTVTTWTLDGTVPGPHLRVQVGDRLRLTLRNQLPVQTSLHWHGLELRNDMDGAPGATGSAIPPGRSFTYDFIVPSTPGTYFFHSHVGTQLDTGLYAPLVVEDPAVPRDYDTDAVLMVDDWTDGLGRTPDQVLGDLQARGMAGMAGGPGGMSGMGMSGMDRGGGGMSPLGADAGDVAYPAYLVNGRLPEQPQVLSARPGQRIRLRLVNAGSDTVFRFAVGGHRLTVVAADGRPVRPVDVDALLVAMGERYDVEITAGTGVFPLTAAPEGKDGVAMAVLRTASGPLPNPAERPAELNGRLLTYADLHPTAADVLPARRPDQVITLRLGGDMTDYRWTINGRSFDDSAHDPTANHPRELRVHQGQRIRLVFQNATMMAHPMHMHGHTFAVLAPTSNGARKDTVLVPPMGTVTVEFDADNPGQWMIHCHNAYHAAAGMMTILSYVT
jgi:FtsP/CotA-like multicopper oxidase with cupredoxin domain